MIYTHISSKGSSLSLTRVRENIIVCGYEKLRRIKAECIVENQNIIIETIESEANNRTIADVSKEYGIGKNTLFKALRDLEIFRYNDKGNNVPYQKYIDSSYFEVIHKTFKKANKNENIGYSQTMITPKGYTWLCLYLRDEGYTKPKYIENQYQFGVAE